MPVARHVGPGLETESNPLEEKQAGGAGSRGPGSQCCKRSQRPRNQLSEQPAGVSALPGEWEGFRAFTLGPWAVGRGPLISGEQATLVGSRSPDAGD